MSVREFGVCLQGLPDTSQFLRALARAPKAADSPDEIAAAFGSFLGGDAATE
jgi:hypothetical protein